MEVLNDRQGDPANRNHAYYRPWLPRSPQGVTRPLGAALAEARLQGMALAVRKLARAAL